MHSNTAEGNIGLVWDVLNRHFGGGKSFRFMGFEPDDLFQVGAIGLMKAVERFDPSKEVKFSTYASTMIFGEVKREIRDNGRMVRFPRTVNEIVAKIVKQDRKETITVDEIASEYRVSREYASMVVTRLLYSNVSGDSIVVESEGNNALTLFDTIGDESTSVEEQALTPIELEQRLSVLNGRERDIVELSLNGLTQKQVADKMGISQMHVSRLLRKSIEKIQNRFDNVITV